MASPKFTKAYCEESETSFLVGNYALALAVRELSALTELFSNRSRVGQVRIRLPREEVPTRYLRIVLQPLGSVFSGLGVDRSMSKIRCWHPALDFRSTVILSSLGILTSGNSMVCENPDPKQVAKDLDRYLGDLLVSERDFMLTNGNYKILRLPEGDYEYLLEAFSEDPLNWNSTTAIKQGQGQLSWSGRQPRAHIRNW